LFSYNLRKASGVVVVGTRAPLGSPSLLSLKAVGTSVFGIMLSAAGVSANVVVVVVSSSLSSLPNLLAPPATLGLTQDTHTRKHIYIHTYICTCTCIEFSSALYIRFSALLRSFAAHTVQFRQLPFASLSACCSQRPSRTYTHTHMYKYIFRLLCLLLMLLFSLRFALMFFRLAWLGLPLHMASQLTSLPSVVSCFAYSIPHIFATAAAVAVTGNQFAAVALTLALLLFLFLPLPFPPIRISCIWIVSSPVA